MMTTASFDEYFQEWLSGANFEDLSLGETAPALENLMGEDGLLEAPLLPLRDLIVFPNMVTPLFVGRHRSVQAVEETNLNNGHLNRSLPEGAIPKDGPSAGVTMATVLVSALTEQPVKRDVAMTGEITLRGRVLAVGGVREKVLAAHRAGIKHLLLPQRNEKDLAEISKRIRRQLDLVLVETMDQVLDQALLCDSSELSESS
jgi:ATP-dependent Lon protease